MVFVYFFILSLGSHIVTNSAIDFMYYLFGPENRDKVVGNVHTTAKQKGK